MAKPDKSVALVRRAARDHKTQPIVLTLTNGTAPARQRRVVPIAPLPLTKSGGCPGCGYTITGPAHHSGEAGFSKAFGAKVLLFHPETGEVRVSCRKCKTLLVARAGSRR